MQVQASWVHIPVDDALGVEVSDCRSHLPEDAESVEEGHLSFAKLLPAANVVGCLAIKH